MADSRHALTDAELTELDEFLLSDACSDETLSIDEAHGLATASHAGPDPLSDEAFVEAVWGSPEFDSDTQRQRFSEMLIKLYHEVGDTLRSGRPFEPLVVEEEDEGELFEVYEGWCFGFMLGVERNQNSWEELPSDQEALLMPMAQLALLTGEEETEMDEDEYLAWVELIPGAVAGLYGYWHGNGQTH